MFTSSSQDDRYCHVGKCDLHRSTNRTLMKFAKTLTEWFYQLPVRNTEKESTDMKPKKYRKGQFIPGGGQRRN